MEIPMAVQAPMPFTFGAAAFVISSFVYCAYRMAMPKPIPGIPYKKASASKLLGDMPDVLKWNRDTKEIWNYIRKLGVELDTPVFQMFMKPFTKPWIVVTDFREAQDIQMHRTNEFDRAKFLGECFKPLLPGSHVWMQTGDTFKSHRQLIRDLMSPFFLIDVAGPQIYSYTQKMLQLWNERSRLAEGRPFEADQDLFRGTVDMILAATFGIHVGSLDTQYKYLSTCDSIDVPKDPDSPVNFPVVAEPKEFVAMRKLVDSIEIALNSPMPQRHLRFALNWFPSLVSARKYKDNMIGGQIKAAWKKFSDNPDAHDRVKSAIDLLVQREAQMARKEGRKIGYDSPAIRDETFGLLVAGHETTSTTLLWAVKYLTEHQDVQRKLRDALKTAHTRATAEGSPPICKEIAKTNVPYLEAFIEENHRLGNTVPAIGRSALQDTTVLGYSVPKGTDVWMLTNGPSFQTAAFHVDEPSRAKNAQDAKDKYGVWDPADVEEFKPERWLVKDEKDGVRFDSRAGPSMAYGYGQRSCFGMKLAQLELKIIISLTLWEFELLPTPPSLSSFNGHDKNTHRPQQCYLRLSKLN